jgi:hypothetical protein
MGSHTRLILRGGLFAGLLGYATVALFFAGLNLIAGRSIFHTAAMFGAALFYGLDDPARLEIAAGPVLSYNMVHALGFVAIGLLASWLVAKAEKYPVAQYGLFVALVFVVAHLYAGLLIFARPLLGGDAWWQIGLASVAAAVVMGWYLLRQHPLLRWELRHIDMGEAPPRGV